MPRGGYRPGAGRPKGARDQKPRKTKKTRSKPDKPDQNREKIGELLKHGAVAKAKIYQEFLQRVAAGEKLSLAEKKMMAKIEDELSEVIGGGGQGPDTESTDLDPDAFLRQVWNDPNIDISHRIRAAEVVLKGKDGKQSKKKDREDRAKQAASGKFASGAPPLKRVK